MADERNENITSIEAKFAQLVEKNKNTCKALRELRKEHEKMIKEKDEQLTQKLQELEDNTKSFQEKMRALTAQQDAALAES